MTASTAELYRHLSSVVWTALFHALHPQDTNSAPAGTNAVRDCERNSACQQLPTVDALIAVLAGIAPHKKPRFFLDFPHKEPHSNRGKSRHPAAAAPRSRAALPRPVGRRPCIRSHLPAHISVVTDATTYLPCRAVDARRSRRPRPNSQSLGRTSGGRRRAKVEKNVIRPHSLERKPMKS